MAGVKMGGKDVVHIKQLKDSDLGLIEVEKLLQQVADERFSKDSIGSSNGSTTNISGKLK